MKFLFIAQGCIPFHNGTLEQRPLGGIETGIIRLAQELKSAGEEVLVATALSNPPLSEPLYVPLSSVGEIRDVDVLIVVRDWQPLLAPIAAKRRLFWTGDSYDQPQTRGIGDPRVVERCHALLTVSDWQADRMSASSGFPRARCWTIRNGVHRPYFGGSELRNPRRLIYSSTPYRGLEFLPAIFPLVRQHVPEAELHIFSDFAVYAGAGDYPEPIVQRFRQVRDLMSRIPGCHFHGNVIQQQLAREFMRSAVLCYPNTFEETSCITVLEAQSAGCPAVTTKLGALPETVGDAGILIDPPVNSPKYKEDFARACIALLTNDQLWRQASENALRKRDQLGWDSVARRLLGFLRNS